MNTCEIITKVDLANLENGIAYECDLYGFRAYKVYRYALKNWKAELSGSGIYFLDCGMKLEDQEGKHQNRKRQIYIGESSNVLDRLKKHNLTPPSGLRNENLEWTVALCFIGKSELAEKTRLWLEKKLVSFLKNEGGKRFDVHTKNTSCKQFEDNNALTNAFEEIRAYLAAMGIDTYVRAKVEEDEGRYFCKIPNSDKRAYGYPTPTGFMVKKDSHVSEKIYDNFRPESYWRLRKELEDRDKNPYIKNRRFVHDYEFRSASEAAAVVRGCSSNGQNEWRILVDGTEMSMKEFQST